ncbi:2-oxo acid dehydrogenase subunit E2 [Nonomuraea sediminis]|uniref:2-oxo acid dehydrogenase subunit E2 n=1 Tax=Nonomuraea sediminis TaxID=2835864 RepID=UPI001BDBF0CA|nr:2-oxo acid dehydrogenase subunit E2 [Nonomuraea sediminis]
MGDLVLPKLNPNDTEYLLVEWLVADGKPVRAGEPVAVVESSKAASELEADSDGHLAHAVPAGTWCAPGTVLARIGGEPATSSATVERAPAEDGLVITEPARAAMAELGVTAEQVAALGLRIVRRADVEGLKGDAVPLTRVQRAVGRAVTLSHDTIPAAYTVVRFDLRPALALAAQLTERVRRPVGLAEIFVGALAALHAGHPLFFATLDGDVARLSDKPHVGVTFDLGDGLYVPVVHDAGSLGPKELATMLMRYRVKAARGGFEDAELSGANITLTLHTEQDVVLAIPFVFPGQACALALPAPRPDGTADVGLAYDHRLINGRDAALFLGALKIEVESHHD